MSKRYIIKTILLALMFMLLAVAGVLVYKYWPRTLPPEQCSEVYRHYCNRSDLNVAFVKDYRIGDSITVDVTTITAKDSIGWEALMTEMNIYDEQKESMRKALSRGRGFVISHYCEKGRPETVCGLDIPNIDLVVISPVDREFYIFNVTSKEQAHTIMKTKQIEIVHKKPTHTK